ncbi:nitric oxide reductase transcriptional regulator NorR [Photobacterium swingsii]|uniref:nitric oxide reductase transcriptional regulator NorR n=1 Tax=Photobacterium swingsii TaxID=680026 RepID=UPI00352DCEBA
MEQVSKEWVQVALGITSGMSNTERFTQLLSTVNQTLKSDASALLLFKDQQFVPLAINGLSHDVLGRRFDIQQHPRLEVIARAGDVVRFPADSDLADPYDGLIPNHDDELKVHACIGLPLMQEDRLIGALTIDAFDPERFDRLSNNSLRMISALASSSLNTALLQEKLEKSTGFTPPENRSLKMASEVVDIIGQSAGIATLKQHIGVVANTDLSVLIMGETGVGKELVAKSIHHQSDRADKPMIYLNCAALPESVAESELFGHVKGAFTGAISNRRGKFELADGGTLFLDEIGELSLPLQAKLLRALQYGDIQRVGDEKNIKVDVRIIAATNRIMPEEVVAERFRADLYHRLSVFPITVPPLRERDKDVVLLAGFFAERCAAKLGGATIRLDAQVLRMIQSYSWRGNVRELEHAINRAAVLARAESVDELLLLLPHHFNFAKPGALSTRSGVDGTRGDSVVTDTCMDKAATYPLDDELDFAAYCELGLKEALDQFQSALVAKVYNTNKQNLSQTARDLKVNPGNLHRLMKRLQLK